MTPDNGKPRFVLDSTNRADRVYYVEEVNTGTILGLGSTPSAAVRATVEILHDYPRIAASIGLSDAASLLVQHMYGTIEGTFEEEG